MPPGLNRLPALRAAVTAAGAPVSITVEGDLVSLPAAVDHAAYRILQESLTNVLRHARQGATATVYLHYQPDALIIRVTNVGTRGTGDGVAARGDGNGICGMRERAAAAGGRLTAGPRSGGGFEVTATLPIAIDGDMDGTTAGVWPETSGAGTSRAHTDVDVSAETLGAGGAPAGGGSAGAGSAGAGRARAGRTGRGAR